MAKYVKKGDRTAPVPADLSANDLLKAKLRQKYNLLKDEPLNYDDRDQLLDHVCAILGMDRPKLDWIVSDL
jgi:hypothetical protein